MMDIRQLGEAIYQAELWVSNVVVVPDELKHTVRAGLKEMQRAKARYSDHGTQGTVGTVGTVDTVDTVDTAVAPWASPR